jgi:hypothetical protein
LDTNLAINGKKRDKLQKLRKPVAYESIESSKSSPIANKGQKDVKIDRLGWRKGRRAAPGEGFEPSRPSRATSFIVPNFQACALPG